MNRDCLVTWSGSASLALAERDRHACEQFHVGTILFLENYTVSPRISKRTTHGSEGCVCDGVTGDGEGGQPAVQGFSLL